MNLKTDVEIAVEVAGRVRCLRVARELTQEEVSKRAGISLSSYRRFEQRGRIEFLSLIRIGRVLHAEGSFDDLIPMPVANSLDEIENRAHRAPKKPRVYKRV